MTEPWIHSKKPPGVWVGNVFYPDFFGDRFLDSITELSDILFDATMDDVFFQQEIAKISTYFSKNKNE